MPAPTSWNAQGYGVVESRITRHVLYCFGCWMYRLQHHPAGCSGLFLEGGDGPGARAHDVSALSIGCEEHTVNNIVWWVGAIVIILAILGFLGFR